MSTKKGNATCQANAKVITKAQKRAIGKRKFAVEKRNDVSDEEESSSDESEGDSSDEASTSDDFSSSDEEEDRQSELRKKELAELYIYLLL